MVKARTRVVSVVGAIALAAAPLVTATSAQAAGSTCSSQRIKIVLSFQPDQAKARATCSPLQKGMKFKAILTSNRFPNAVSGWRVTAGSVDTGTRPWASSTGSDVQTAKR